MYSRAMMIEHENALDAIDQCISAACVGTDNYGLRLVPYAGAFAEIAELFRDSRDQNKFLALSVHLMESKRLTGIEIKRDVDPLVMMARRKIKGALMSTRTMLAGAGPKSKCLKPLVHAQPCYCKKLVQFTSAQFAAGEEGINGVMAR